MIGGLPWNQATGANSAWRTPNRNSTEMSFDPSSCAAASDIVGFPPVMAKEVVDGNAPIAVGGNREIVQFLLPQRWISGQGRLDKMSAAGRPIFGRLHHERKR